MKSQEPTVELVVTLPRLAPRPTDSNKGTFGRVLVVAGSRGMSGAAILSGTAALRGGAGLVRVAVPEGILPVVAAGNPCYVTIPLPQDAGGHLSAAAENDLLENARGHDVVAIGPGLGHGEGITKLVSALIAQTDVPVVLDADGLNAMQGHVDRLRGRRAPLILTPHPGEFGRLLGISAAEVQKQRPALAVPFAAKHGVVLLLKGSATIVTDGHRIYVNGTGNPGMATGGTGDVLTGLIAALLGQRLQPFAAAQLGAHLHGLAGDLARDALGEVSLIATDLLERLPQAFLKY